MTQLASYRVPYWAAFAWTLSLLALALLAVALWENDWASLFLVAFVAFCLESFLHRTLYSLEIDAESIHGRSLLKHWELPLGEIEALVPGWRRPLWRRNSNMYIVKRRRGPRLLIWCGKGLHDFLTVVGTVEPRLQPSIEDDVSRAERSRGHSGFVQHVC
jgi:hypothetical protein